MNNNLSWQDILAPCHTFYFFFFIGFASISSFLPPKELSDTGKWAHTHTLVWCTKRGSFTCATVRFETNAQVILHRVTAHLARFRWLGSGVPLHSINFPSSLFFFFPGWWNTPFLLRFLEIPLILNLKIAIVGAWWVGWWVGGWVVLFHQKDGGIGPCVVCESYAHI